MPTMMACELAWLMPPVLRLGAGPAIRRADRTVTGWTASGSYEVTSRPIAGRRPADRHVGTMTPGQSSWGSDPPNDANTLTDQCRGLAFIADAMRADPRRPARPHRAGPAERRRAPRPGRPPELRAGAPARARPTGRPAGRVGIVATRPAAERRGSSGVLSRHGSEPGGAAAGPQR